MKFIKVSFVTAKSWKQPNVIQWKPASFYVFMMLMKSKTQPRSQSQRFLELKDTLGQVFHIYLQMMQNPKPTEVKWFG